MKYVYEIRKIDAWGNKEDGYEYNETFHIANFTTKGENHKRAFLNALHKNGFICERGKCVVLDDGYIFELCNRKTLEPLMCAIPVNL